MRAPGIWQDVYGHGQLRQVEMMEGAVEQCKQRPLDMEALYDMPITKESSQNIVKCIMEAIDTIKMELESEGKAVNIKGNS